MMGEYFAVIDTETNWQDEIMSIGMVIADAEGHCAVCSLYRILFPEYLVGGMFVRSLGLKNPDTPRPCTRSEALGLLEDCLSRYHVEKLFAYNACFDKRHLPELHGYSWYDIMKIAAYQQHNSKIPSSAQVCGTGRLKWGYDVESMLRLLSGNQHYAEKHNALQDAEDELNIMRLLKKPMEIYENFAFVK